MLHNDYPGYESESQQDKARQGMHTSERTSILVNASPSKQLLPPTHHPHALLSFSTAYYEHIFLGQKNWPLLILDTKVKYPAS